MFEWKTATGALAAAVSMLGLWAPGAGATGTPGWAAQPILGPPETGALSAVSCAPSGACTAVGGAEGRAGSTRALVVHDNGRGWSVQATPDPAGADGARLTGVSCTSATACTAVGGSHTRTGSASALAETWNGRAWSLEVTPRPAGAKDSAFNDVSCTSGSVCTAVGFFQNRAGLTFALVERSSGSRWSIQPTPPVPAGALDAVSCTSSIACTAVGSLTTGGFQVPLAEHFDGISWSLEQTPDPRADAGELNSVSCTAQGCTAVGAVAYSEPVLPALFPLAEHSAQNGWSVESTVNPAVIGGLWAVSCLSATACTAVGDSRRVQRWNGSSWSTESTTGDGYLDGVSCTTATSCVAVGAADPGAWSTTPVIERR